MATWQRIAERAEAENLRLEKIIKQLDQVVIRRNSLNTDLRVGINRLIVAVETVRDLPDATMHKDYELARDNLNNEIINIQKI